MIPLAKLDPEVPFARLVGTIFVTKVLDLPIILDNGGLEHLGDRILQNRHLITAVIDAVICMDDPRVGYFVVNLTEAFNRAPLQFIRQARIV